MLAVLPLGGAMAFTLILGWFVRRYQRDIDAYHVREYREPPVFTWPPVG